MTHASDGAPDDAPKNGACSHPNIRRKFGGAILCDDCDAEDLGDWRVNEGARRVAFPAAQDPDGTFRITGGSL